ncbi:MAG: MarR family winged helix-turn-helix transcriptional regulator [Anaerolineales bacterium]|jgi:DNA-binding MarR family transcriptional regulator
MTETPDEGGAELLEIVPQLMRVIRDQMRQHRTADLSVPEFRTLGFLNQHSGSSLIAVAEHIGLSPASMSRLVDGLVRRSLVKRERKQDAVDRRYVTLGLTANGRAILKSARASTQAYLAEVLTVLSPAEQAMVVQAMQLLSPLFSTKREKERMSTRGPGDHF